MTELNEQLIGCEATGRGTNKEEEISERELAGEKCSGGCPGVKCPCIGQCPDFHAGLQSSTYSGYDL